MKRETIISEYHNLIKRNIIKDHTWIYTYDLEKANRMTVVLKVSQDH